MNENIDPILEEIQSPGKPEVCKSLEVAKRKIFSKRPSFPIDSQIAKTSFRNITALNTQTIQPPVCLN